MTAHIYTEADAPIDPLKGKKIAVIGYGSQGHAHALNAHDSGLDVSDRPVQGLEVVGRRREGRAARSPKSPRPPRQADVIVMLVPDEKQRRIFDDEHSAAGHAWQVAGLGARLQHPLQADRAARGRRRVDGRARRRPGTACASCSSRARACRRWWPSSRTPPGKAWELAFAYGNAVGSAKAGLIKTTFKEETETDLFGEQSVLCGGITSLIKAGWEVAGRGRLSARSRLLRVPERDEADRRPDVRGRHGAHALLDQRHGRVRRLRLGPAHHRRVGQAAHARRAEGDPGRHVRPPLAGRKRARAAPTSTDTARRPPRTPMEKVGQDLRSLMNKQGLTDHHRTRQQRMADYVTISRYHAARRRAGAGLLADLAAEGRDGAAAGAAGRGRHRGRLPGRQRRRLRRGAAASPAKSAARSIAGLARAVAADIDQCWEAIRDAERAADPTFLSASDIHLEAAVPPAARRGQGARRAMVARASGYTSDVEFSPMDATRADWAYVCEVLEAVIDAGATTVNIADTCGFAQPDELAAHDRLHPRARRQHRPRHASRCTATTTSAWPWPTAWRRSRPAPARSSAASTASANGPATRRSKSWSWR